MAIAIRIICLGLLVVGSFRNLAAQDSLQKKEWNVDGTARQALVWIPQDSPVALKEGESPKKHPLVFCFHGHGGSMRNAANTFAIHREWPSAVVVYMQGLNTPGRLTDPEGKKPGWQHEMGELNDRDLKFFDAVLDTLKKEQSIDEHRIYSTGHSNGGGFTYLLWATRGDLFAAMAPSAAVPNPKYRERVRPKPVMHIAGENDALVKFERQAQAMASLRKLNDTSEEGMAWAEQCVVYESPNGMPVVTMITEAGHKFPEKAPPLIVRFFKEHAKPDTH